MFTLKKKTKIDFASDCSIIRCKIKNHKLQ